MVMYKDEIDIDECLASLWVQVYAAVVRIADCRSLRDKEMPLPGDGRVKTLLVTYDGVIRIGDVYGNEADVEDFDDDVLYEVYRRFRKM